MFSLKVTDTDKFLDMSASAQSLYFHLGMHGDDDGFVSSPRKIARAAGCNDDDLRLLVAKEYIIPFESGVVVITDWNINNTLKNDRYHPTIYTAEKSMLTTDCTGRLMLGGGQETTWNQNGTISEPERNLTQLNLTKLNKGDKAATPPRAKRFTPPTLAEVQAYVLERQSPVDPQEFIDFYESKGWLVGKTPMKDWKAACRNAEKWGRWNRNDSRSKVKTTADYGTEDFFNA
jgi:hypothetical protein